MLRELTAVALLEFEHATAAGEEAQAFAAMQVAGVLMELVDAFEASW